VAGYALKVSDEEVGRYRGMAERARASESGLWSTAGIGPGAVVGDIGCGPAAVSVVMAEVVGSTGRIIGVEQDESALDAAHQVVEQSAAVNVELVQGTATDTGIAPGSLDVAVMRHVLAHNGSQEAEIVEHLATLVRPGGCVYLVDIDGTAFRNLDLDADLGDLHDKYIAFHRQRGNDLQPGLRLGKHLRTAGLDVLEHVGMYTVTAAPVGIRSPAWAARQAMLDDGAATEQDVARWEAAFVRSDEQESRPTVFMPVFIAVGRK